MSDKDIVICRCEDITLGEIRSLLDEGFLTVDEVKRISRCGMGPCQGKTCRDLVLQEISLKTGRPVKDLRMPTFRPPTKPVKLGVIARGEEDDV
ncbi:MAG: (2Fe-2S)-binding protein [Bacillota bacterium]